MTLKWNMSHVYYFSNAKSSLLTSWNTCLWFLDSKSQLSSFELQKVLLDEHAILIGKPIGTYFKLCSRTNVKVEIKIQEDWQLDSNWNLYWTESSRNYNQSVLNIMHYLNVTFSLKRDLQMFLIEFEIAK